MQKRQKKVFFGKKKIETFTALLFLLFAASSLYFQGCCYKIIEKKFKQKIQCSLSESRKLGGESFFFSIGLFRLCPRVAVFFRFVSFKKKKERKTRCEKRSTHFRRWMMRAKGGGEEKGKKDT